MADQFFTCFLFYFLYLKNMRIVFIRNITNLLILEDLIYIYLEKEIGLRKY